MTSEKCHYLKHPQQVGYNENANIVYKNQAIAILYTMKKYQLPKKS